MPSRLRYRSIITPLKCYHNFKIITTFPTLYSNIIIKGLTIIAPVPSPNTDGINPGEHQKIISCIYVHVESVSSKNVKRISFDHLILRKC